MAADSIIDSSPPVIFAASRPLGLGLGRCEPEAPGPGSRPLGLGRRRCEPEAPGPASRPLGLGRRRCEPDAPRRFELDASTRLTAR